MSDDCLSLLKRKQDSKTDEVLYHTVHHPTIMSERDKEYALTYNLFLFVSELNQTEKTSDILCRIEM